MVKAAHFFAGLSIGMIPADVVVHHAAYVAFDLVAAISCLIGSLLIERSEKKRSAQ